ncbi:hypothetical protein BCR35DRAFT_303673 [Leucosporidium creatinivorum]|uniref:Uncharacterized protein n=1 Tax=Leucosporidium creatinivorum TaxID=106004 RepID=A0A1Y2FGF6_9BASI|nr:hypothetical protein BCR35DRAFT_303673 [Leucosporidium creatinivorum]
MRESNFNLPAQNRACVCISQALYDRRGEPSLDHPRALQLRPCLALLVAPEGFLSLRQG